MRITRREMIKSSLLTLGAASLLPNLSGKEKNVYEVGAWMSGLGDFERAKKIGLDVIQVSFPFRPNGAENDFRSPEARAEYLEKSAQTGVRIEAFAMGEFNEHPFWTQDDTIEQVSACIDAMRAMNVKYVLISYFGAGDPQTDDDWDEIIRRYKILAPKAENAGVALTIEAPWTAEGHHRVVDAVDSPAVRVFYDPGNMVNLFGDTEWICNDIRKLKGLIRGCHIKDDNILGKGQIDYQKVLDTYREIGFFGPQIVEGSVVGELGWEESMRQNIAYIKSL
ncbi:MAG: sugar phosphate isomerase/epimerase [Thermoguttaceae bacterium]|nr:sugar phosphate isomerase/epimerase [Thermoguttaceae bacterium]